MGALDVLAKAAKAVKKTGPFFSKADVLLDELQRGKGTGDEFLTELVKKGAKPTELRERGIEGALKGKPKMTKAEVKQVFEEKAPPKIKEEIRGGDEYKEALDEKAREIIGDEYATFDDLHGRDREYAKFSVEKDLGYTPETKHEEWRTPGGQNYREILLKIPQRGLNEAEKRILMNYEADVRRGEQLNPWHQRQYDALKAKEAMGSQDFYHRQHWGDTPNVLAHIRVQDFKTPEGKKVLLVDEIQSDWHQEGRKKGYKKQGELPPGHEIEQEEHGLYVIRNQDGEVVSSGPTPELALDFLDTGYQKSAVPDAPFKKNWHELAMKRVLDYAAENGYDTVAITPGAEQAKRYDLSKHINELFYKKNPDGTYSITAQGKDLGNLIEETVPADKLQNFVGKEVADKIIGGQGKTIEVEGQYDYVTGKSSKEQVQSLSGLDLTVGGEGMKGFYDKILTDYLNTYGKQYGASVGQMDLPLGYTDESKRLINDAYARGTRADIDLANAQAKMQTMPVHRFDITPQMREQIKTKGQPLYSKIGVPGAEAAAATGAATIGAEATQNNTEQPVQNPVHFTENPDAMLLELMQRN